MCVLIAIYIKGQGRPVQRKSIGFVQSVSVGTQVWILLLAKRRQEFFVPKFCIKYYPYSWKYVTGIQELTKTPSIGEEL